MKVTKFVLVISLALVILIRCALILVKENNFVFLINILKSDTIALIVLMQRLIVFLI